MCLELTSLTGGGGESLFIISVVTTLIVESYSIDTKTSYLCLHYDKLIISSKLSPEVEIFIYRCPIEVGEVWIKPSGLVFADLDGVLIIPQEIESEVIVQALKKARVEKVVRKDIKNGLSSTDAFKKYRIL
jgi:hypothetical protein